MKPPWRLLLLYLHIHTMVHGKNMSSKDADEVFGAHVPLGRCKPGRLWVVPKLTRQGLTSCWSEVKKSYQIISSILDKTEGNIPCQKSLTSQFAAFLSKQDMNWSEGDIEKSTYNLRSQMRSLRNLKVAPRGHEILGAIISKFASSGGDAERDDAVDEEPLFDDDEDDDQDDDDDARTTEIDSDSPQFIAKPAYTPYGSPDVEKKAVDPRALPFIGFRFDQDVMTPWTQASNQVIVAAASTKKKKKKQTRSSR